MAYARSYSRLRQQLSLGSAVVLAVVVFVSFRVLGVSPSQLILLLFLFARLVPRITGIYERVQELAAALPAVAAVDELERSCVDAAEAPSTRRCGIEFHDSIALERVTFAYGDPTRPPAVVDLTLRIRSGTTVAVVGPSGAGKSTVADLLMGLLVPDSGRILIDGTTLDADRLEAWREQIGYVPQDTFLFHDTIAANLRWALPAASDEELWAALRQASAEAFVRRLPRGIETIVGDRGVLLSAGERQRISVARALLRRPKLLILDEATSALDSENERRIQEAIDGLHGHVTILVITHRLAAVRGADVIHVMERGRIVESGTWAALLARPGGRFRELCRAQGLEGQTTAAAATEGEPAAAAVTR